MPTKNLWGQLPTPEEIRTPTQILKEQAALLTDMTKGVLQGAVTVATGEANRFTLRLDILAPVIDNYRYGVLTAFHGVELYPVTVSPIFKREGSGLGVAQCTNEAALELALEQILSSQPIRRVVSALLAQSRAM